MEGELGAQVRDAAAEIAPQAWGVVIHVPLEPIGKVSGVADEPAVVGQLGPSFGGGVAQDVYRVPGPRPPVGVDAGEQPERLWMPGPPQVLGQVAQPFQPGWSGQVHALDRRDPDG